MTNLENKIPIKSYATFDPLKHCWIGSGFKTEWFSDLDIYKNDKIMDPLKRIAEETEEDYQDLEKILKDAGVKTYRSVLDREKYKTLEKIMRPPMFPRDHFAVVGEKLYVTGGAHFTFEDMIRSVDRKDLHIEVSLPHKAGELDVNSACMTRVGKDIWWDVEKPPADNYHTFRTDNYASKQDRQKSIDKYKNMWEEQGFRVHLTHRGYHSDGVLSVVKPGCIVSLADVHNYEKDFPGWDVLYLPDSHFSYHSDFNKMKDKVGGRWWLKGEEHNDQLIDFVNTWLNDWVGLVAETVFDVNMLSIDQNTIICNNYNKEVFAHFKKHKVEPIIYNFRHRYFWDGGIHCMTQDLYREGTMVDYFE